MSRPPLEVADLIRSAGAAFIERNHQWLSWKHIKVLLAIARCRTAALGGHLDQCTRCGHRATISYNSCRNRHCLMPGSYRQIFKGEYSVPLQRPFVWNNWAVVGVLSLVIAAFLSLQGLSDGRARLVR
jgi:hypothetical protein